MIDVPIQVKDILRDGRRTKTYRVNVLNEDGTVDFTIDNNTLVKESVDLDERMCSGDTIKFGLCEGSSIEFRYFDHPNINGRQIQIFIDIVYGENQTCAIPMGFFTVQKCSRQASTGIIKVTAYNKLKSEYLDQKANAILEENVVDDSIDLTIYSIRDTLLKQFEIQPYQYIQVIPISSVPGSMGATITNNVKLSNVTSDDGVINYYSLEEGAISRGITLNTNTTLVISIDSSYLRWEIPDDDDGYFRFLQTMAHDFAKLEENFANYLRDFLDACPLTKSGEQLINEVKSIDNWGRLFGLYFPNVDKSYNDYAYIHQNDGANRVNGAVSDIIKQLFSNETEAEYGRQFILCIPQAVVVAVPLGGGTLGSIATFRLLGDGDISYQGRYSIKTYPKFHYENGEPIPDITNPFNDWFSFCKVEGLTDADLIKLTPATMPEFTLRDIVSASYETVCQCGQLSRETDLFSGVELNHSRLLPQETLYPANDLYPGGAQTSATKAMYSKLWADEGNVHKWRYLIITYKGLDEEQKEKEFTLQRTVNADGTDDYNCSDNWLFKNLVWTAEQIGAYADAMVAKMRDITWFPFEMWCAGLPYVETGDEIEIPFGEESYTSYILQRQLKGIQNLQDTYINGTLDIF